jgi:hypothetical protein
MALLVQNDIGGFRMRFHTSTIGYRSEKIYKGLVRDLTLSILIRRTSASYTGSGHFFEEPLIGWKTSKAMLEGGKRRAEGGR